MGLSATVLARGMQPVTATAAVGSASRFPGDPGLGKILWGQSREGSIPAIPARAVQYAQIVGQSQPLYPKAVHRYIPPDQSTVAGAQAAVADAAMVQSWGSYYVVDVKEPGSMSFAQVGTGGMDQVIDTVMQGLVALGKPACVGFHNEPVGDGKGGATDCGAAVQRFAQRRDAAGGKGLITVTCTLGIGSFTGYGGANGPPDPWITALAPWRDVNATNRYLQATDASSPSAWKTVQQVYGQYWDLEDSLSPKPARFQLEWGVHTRASDLTFAPAWMDSFMSYGISRGLALACFFDSGQNSANDWTLDLGGETSRLQKMARQLAA